MKLWLFGSYSWQGNPKALLMYMQKHNAQTHDVWWVADTRDEMRLVKRLGYKAILASSSKAAKLFAEADVYVTENFRETYPASLNPNAIILNLWHGVGLKHIELGLGAESALADGIVKNTSEIIHYIRIISNFWRPLRLWKNISLKTCHSMKGKSLRVGIHGIKFIEILKCALTTGHWTLLIISIKFIYMHQHIGIKMLMVHSSNSYLI
ncbi:Uncharacterised protein [Weissella viridescens]|uniref:Uncharacterized protein n=1 Tax=Weissella viridescens TaxID=1629 RepID=A0A380P1C0_WEIVI|nr:Uncharacterised protein [Weissella viridescens]